MACLSFLCSGATQNQEASFFRRGFCVGLGGVWRPCLVEAWLLNHETLAEVFACCLPFFFNGWGSPLLSCSRKQPRLPKKRENSGRRQPASRWIMDNKTNRLSHLCFPQQRTHTRQCTIIRSLSKSSARGKCTVHGWVRLAAATVVSAATSACVPLRFQSVFGSLFGDCIADAPTMRPKNFFSVTVPRPQRFKVTSKDNMTYEHGGDSREWGCLTSHFCELDVKCIFSYSSCLCLCSNEVARRTPKCSDK